MSKNINTYKGNIVPSPEIIFVFGSNPEGRHGRGAAAVARYSFGAKYGQGSGLMGNSYGIVTKDLRVKKNNGYKSVSKKDIIKNILEMYECAKEHPDKKFMVAYRNKSNERTLCGYTGNELFWMFVEAGPIPSNVYFSEDWVLDKDNKEVIESIRSIPD